MCCQKFCFSRVPLGFGCLSFAVSEGLQLWYQVTDGFMRKRQRVQDSVFLESVVVDRRHEISLKQKTNTHIKKKKKWVHVPTLTDDTVVQKQTCPWARHQNQKLLCGSYNCLTVAVLLPGERGEWNIVCSQWMVNVLPLSHHFIWSGGSLWTGPRSECSAMYLSMKWSLEFTWKIVFGVCVYLV